MSLFPIITPEPGLAGQRQHLQDAPHEFIDPFGGKLHFSFVDIHLPGNSGLDITVRRNYVNLDEAQGIATLEPTSRLGLGWQDIHFGRVLRKNSNEMCIAPSTDRPVLELSNGQRQIFNLVDAAFTPQEYSGYLFVTKARWVAKCNANQLQVWSPDGVRYDFTACGRHGTGYACYATRIVDRHGQHLDLTYNDDSISPNISKDISRVRAAYGRQVDFSYTGTGVARHLTQITGGGRLGNTPTPIAFNLALGSFAF
jgi:hypothetical protein